MLVVFTRKTLVFERRTASPLKLSVSRFEDVQKVCILLLTQLARPDLWLTFGAGPSISAAAFSMPYIRRQWL